jgi:hypothetical protein
MGMPPWQLGKIFPPHVEEELELSGDQERQVHELEKEIKKRVMKVLSGEQKRKLQMLQRHGPGGPRGPDGPLGGGDEPPDRPDHRDPPPPREKTRSNGHSAFIQWFATWNSGLAEAQRSGRPILLVAAAPHCAGVSGTW